MQAMNLCQALGDCKPGMGVAIDVEEESNAVGIDSEVILGNLDTMIDYLQLRGYNIVLYSNKDGFIEYFQDHSPDTRYGCVRLAMILRLRISTGLFGNIHMRDAWMA